MLLNELIADLQKFTKEKITYEKIAKALGLKGKQSVGMRISRKKPLEEWEIAKLRDVFSNSNSYLLRKYSKDFSTKGWGYNIQKLRAENGLTMDNFCKLTGIKEDDLIAYVNDDKEPSVSDLIKIKNHFDISIDELLFNNDYKESDN